MPKKTSRSGSICRPMIGKVISLMNGEARILRILDYEQVVEEMELNGMKPEDISRFRGRVRHFLGDAKKYFECEVIYANGEIERIDWSEFLALALAKRSSRGSIRC